VAERLTRAQATRMAESVLEYEGTKKGRKCYASEFARDVFKAIAADECTDPRFCSDLALKNVASSMAGQVMDRSLRTVRG